MVYEFGTRPMLRKIEVDHDHEFISFEVWGHEIKLRFGSLAIALFDAIEVISNGQIKVIEDVWNRKGDLNALWPLLGKHMTKLIMDEESCRILFDDGSIVRRKYEPNQHLAEVWGPGGDEFSDYPAILDPRPPQFTVDEMLSKVIRDYKPQEPK
jgi:hypothetical protein